jgi:hypothetical protein
MRKIFIVGLLFVLTQSAAAQTNKVLLIGIDGCRPAAMVAANTPNLDALMANGTFSLDALNTGITISGPGWASLLTGVWPEKHGVTDNGFAGDDFANYPHLFQRIEEYNSSLHTATIVQWHPINNEIAEGVSDIVINVDDHTDFVEEAASDYLTNEDPDALFLHFDDVDHAGHSYGFSPDVPNYITAIETVDAGIGGVLQALYDRPTFSEEQWVIIVSTDHGGLGYSHGGNSIEERNIFMIVSGDGIANEEILADSVLTIVPPAFNCMGDTTELFFDGNAYAESTQSQLFDFGADQDFTIECRVRTSQSGDVAIMTDKDWDSGLNPGWVFSFNVNGGPWKVNVGDGASRVDIEGNEIADDEWHMLSATFDRDGMLTIYEDGTMLDAAPMSSIGDINAAGQIFMGMDADQDYGFTGHIAEARMFAELVEPNTISDWACMHLNETHPNYGFLISQWDMNEGEGSALGNDGANALATSLVGTEWESASDTIMAWERDYSNTPRQVDFMVSALEHLCVPILAAWNLDGEVLATYCQQSPDGLSEWGAQIAVYPNPAQAHLRIEISEVARLIIVDASGRFVDNQMITSEGIVELSNLKLGAYRGMVLNMKGELLGQISFLKTKE